MGKKEKTVKPITFTYDGIDYVLEYSRWSLKQMRAEGFDSSALNEEGDASEKLEMIAILWAGAFYKNHRTAKKALIEEMYEKMPNKTELINRLVELYAEPFKALTAEPSEGEVIRWE